MEPLSLAVVVKLEPDFSKVCTIYNPNWTFNQNETKFTVGAQPTGVNFEKKAAFTGFWKGIKGGPKNNIKMIEEIEKDFAVPQLMEELKKAKKTVLA